MYVSAPGANDTGGVGASSGGRVQGNVVTIRIGTVEWHCMGQTWLISNTSK